MISKMAFTITILISLGANAASATLVDAKKILRIQTGDYKISNSDSAFERENICIDGDIQPIEWLGDADEPILSIGQIKLFENINLGLQTSSAPADRHHCTYSNNTQAQDHRLTEDRFANCDVVEPKTKNAVPRKQNTTTHVELKIKGDTIDYSVEMKVPRGGRVVSVTSNCTFTKVKPSEISKAKRSN